MVLALKNNPSRAVAIEQIHLDAAEELMCLRALPKPNLTKNEEKKVLFNEIHC
jgi:hypothetical protein